MAVPPISRGSSWAAQAAHGANHQLAVRSLGQRQIRCSASAALHPGIADAQVIATLARSSRSHPSVSVPRPLPAAEATQVLHRRNNFEQAGAALALNTVQLRLEPTVVVRGGVGRRRPPAGRPGSIYQRRCRCRARSCGWERTRRGTPPERCASERCVGFVPYICVDGITLCGRRHSRRLSSRCLLCVRGVAVATEYTAGHDSYEKFRRPCQCAGSIRPALYNLPRRCMCSCSCQCSLAWDASFSFPAAGMSPGRPALLACDASSRLG